jgi:hypothetical protein
MYQCIDGAGPGESQEDIDKCQAAVLDRVAKANGVVRKDISSAKKDKQFDFFDDDFVHDDRPAVLPRKPCPPNCKSCTADGANCTECEAGYDTVGGKCQEARKKDHEHSTPIAEQIGEDVKEFGWQVKDKPIETAKMRQNRFGKKEKRKEPKPSRPIAEQIGDHTDSLGKAWDPPPIANRFKDHLDTVGEELEKEVKSIANDMGVGDTWGKSVERERTHKAEMPKALSRNLRGRPNSWGKTTNVEKETGPLPPLGKFLPSCLVHLKRLVKMIDHSYTDMHLQTVLEAECMLEKDFPRSCDSGFERTKHCRDFAKQLHEARMLELDTGSEEGYKQACKDYWELRMDSKDSMNKTNK